MIKLKTASEFAVKTTSYITLTSMFGNNDYQEHVYNNYTQLVFLFLKTGAPTRKTTSIFKSFKI